jgi:hypothetical protein
MSDKQQVSILVSDLVTATSTPGKVKALANLAAFIGRDGS